MQFISKVAHNPTVFTAIKIRVAVSELWRHVAMQDTNVSEDHAASIFRVIMTRTQYPSADCGLDLDNAKRWSCPCA
jgi:hypothetical protein